MERGKLIKGLISFLALIIVLAILWLIPMKSDNVYINLITQGIDDNTGISFEIYSKDAYDEKYSFDTSVVGGVASVRLDYEYISFNKIVIKNADVARAVTGMKILATGIDTADYTVADMEGNILVEDNGEYVFSEEALNAVREGINNPWYLKRIIAGIIVFIYILGILYVLLKKYTDRFKAIAVTCTIFFSALFTFIYRIKGVLEKDIIISGNLIKNSTLVYIVVTMLVILLSLCIIFNKENKNSKVLIIGIYSLILFLSIFKMFFYSEKVANAPDEKAHIGYIAYLEQSGEWIPSFESMETIHAVYDDNETMQMYFEDNTVCYLNHPPLYYHIMKLADGIEFNEDGSFNANVDKMRIFSMSFVVLALIVMFYIGYTRINKIPLYHMLFAMVCTSVPMMMYSAAGVNNDSLTILTVAIFLLGIIRYVEKKRNACTYLLIAVGVSATLLTKMTAGIMVVITGLIVLISSIVKEKCIKELLSPKFLLTILIYLIPIIYYLYVYAEYGGFHPDIFAMNPEFARNSGFYTPIPERMEKGVIEYIWYFIVNFKLTWTGIFSHIVMLKTEEIWFSVQNVALIMIWFFPLFLLIKPLRKKIKYSGGIIAAYISVLITFIMQFVNAYNGYITRGYRGSYQSRYYLCAIVIFAFCIALVVQKVMEALENKGVYAKIIQNGIVSVTVIYIALLAFEDFIYFLINYTNYIT